MNVCIFSRLVSLHSRGGIQHDLDTRAAWLVERGHQVDVMTTRHAQLPALWQQGGVNYHFLPKTRPQRQDGLWRRHSKRYFLDWHASRPFDLVICVGGGGWQYARLLAHQRDLPPAVMLMQMPS